MDNGQEPKELPPMPKRMTMPEGFQNMPANVDAEQAVLGSLLNDNSVLEPVAKHLRAEHFYEPVHRRMYQSIHDTITAGKKADWVTMARQFKDDPELHGLDGHAYVVGLSQAAELTLNVTDYADTVVDLAAKRSIIFLGQHYNNKAFDPGCKEGAAQLLENMASDVAHITNGGVHVSREMAGMDINTIMASRPDPREWLIEGWLPKECVTSFYGDGGVGKSLAALQASIAVAAGSSFFGIQAVQANVLCVFCEDEETEIARRLYAAGQAMDVTATDIEGLVVIPRCGQGFEQSGEVGNIIALPDQDGTINKTHLFERIRTTARKRNCRLIVLDNISHMFGGNENDRTQVTQFINLLNGLAIEIEGSVLLLGHTAKAEGSEYSGSTGWNNAVRSRWFMEKAEQDEDEDDETIKNSRLLTKAKSNYGAAGDQLLVTWTDGAFQRDGNAAGDFMDVLERRAAEKKAEDAFLACLSRLASQKRAVNELATSKSRYAPKVMRRMQEAAGIRLKDLENAMHRLFDKGQLAANEPIARDAFRKMQYGLREVCLGESE